MKKTHHDISEDDRRLLVAVEYRAGSSLKDLARLLDIREASIRRNLARLESAGVISGRTPIIDFTPLRLVEYSMYMSTSARTRRSVSNLMEALAAKDGVTWVGRLVGQFDVCVSIVAEDPCEVSTIIESSLNTSGVDVDEKRLVFRTRSVLYPRRGLAPQLELPPGPACGAKIQRKPLDAVEKKILRVLNRRGVVSDRELERETGIPQATVSRRLRQLEDDGVIAGYAYRYNLNLGGQLSYQLYLSLRSGKSLPDLEQYVATKGRFCQFRHVCGAWDVELEFDRHVTTGNLEECDALLATFGREIASVTTVQRVGTSLYRPFPF